VAALELPSGSGTDRLRMYDRSRMTKRCLRTSLIESKHGVGLYRKHGQVPAQTRLSATTRWKTCSAALDDRPSRARRITLRSSGILSRHYAVDPASGQQTHSNAQMTALAVRAALERANCGIRRSGSAGLRHFQSGPNHAGARAYGTWRTRRSSLRGSLSLRRLLFPACQRSSTPILAFGRAESARAVSSGSELASSFMAARNFSREVPESVDAAEKSPNLAFEKDFLPLDALRRRGRSSGFQPHPKVTARPCASTGSMASRSRTNFQCACTAAQLDCPVDGCAAGAMPPTRGISSANTNFAVKQDARLLDALICAPGLQATPCSRSRGAIISRQTTSTGSCPH